MSGDEIRKKEKGLTKCLKDVTFPAGKVNMIVQAQYRHADNELLDLLKKIPDKIYRSLTEVLMEMKIDIFKPKV